MKASRTKLNSEQRDGVEPQLCNPRCTLAPSGEILHHRMPGSTLSDSISLGWGPCPIISYSSPCDPNWQSRVRTILLGHSGYRNWVNLKPSCKVQAQKHYQLEPRTLPTASWPGNVFARSSSHRNLLNFQLLPNRACCSDKGVSGNSHLNQSTLILLWGREVCWGLSGGLLCTVWRGQPAKAFLLSKKLNRVTLELQFPPRQTLPLASSHCPANCRVSFCFEPNQAE